MKHSDMQKARRSNHGVVCSGNRLCYECTWKRKKNKRVNNRNIRRMNKRLQKEEL